MSTLSVGLGSAPHVAGNDKRPAPLIDGIAPPTQFRPTVLALDLEATLISSAVSQFPRPGLRNFLERCRELFGRIVMFTTVPEDRFRRIAQVLVEEGAAPDWFQELEYVTWTGRTKDLSFIPNCCVEHALLVDDLSEYVHPGQQSQWVPADPFEPPFDVNDEGLAKVLTNLQARVSSWSNL